MLRYGNTRELCLGIEAVLADGRIMHTLTRLRKDNTGYDLRNLMVGSEGTLGVITGAALKLFSRPTRRATAMLVVPSPAAALKLLALARDHAGEQISGFELISGESFRFLEATLPDIRRPFHPAPDWMVLTEVGLSGTGDAEAMMAGILEAAFEAELVTDGVIAQSEAQADELWHLREAIPEANRAIGAISSHDIALPCRPCRIHRGRYRETGRSGPLPPELLWPPGRRQPALQRLPPAGEAKADHMGAKRAIMDLVHDLVASYEGSFSAEHGVGG